MAAVDTTAEATMRSGDALQATDAETQTLAGSLAGRPISRGPISKSQGPRQIRKSKRKSASLAWWHDRRIQIGGGAAAVLILLAGIVISLKPKHENLTIEIDQPDAMVQTTAEPIVVYLDDLQETSWKDGLLQLGKHNLNFNGGKYQWRGREPAHALMTHPQQNLTASVTYRLDGRYEKFSATTGIADEGGQGSSRPVTFRVVGDGRELWKSRPLQKSDEEAAFSVSVVDVKELILEVACGDENFKAEAVWFEPRLTRSGSPPAADSTLDRKVAQWLLDHKFPCNLTVGEKTLGVQPGGTLPTDSFTVEAIGVAPRPTIPREELLAGLGDLKRLTKFNGGYLPTQDADLWAAAYATMPSVKVVNAFSCDLTDQGVAQLARLRQVVYLNLGNCANVTAKGLVRLRNCKSLGTIEIDKAVFDAGKYTLADAQTLQDALPQCRVVFQGVKPIPGLKPGTTGPAVSPASTTRPWESPAFQQWVKEVAALTAEQQVEGRQKEAG